MCMSLQDSIVYEFVFSDQHILFILFGVFVRWEVSAPEPGVS